LGLPATALRSDERTVAVVVGFIALAGVTAETEVVMPICLDNAEAAERVFARK
jgi:Cu/Ag efflux pump CusA